MKYCTYCNAQNPDDAVFCSVCGKNFTPGEPDAQVPPQTPQYNAPPMPPVNPLPPVAPYGMPPIPPKPGDPSKNWMAITGMVLGILSIFPGCCIWYLALVFGVGGIVFGILGLKSQQRGMSIAGIITGAIGLLFGLFVLIFVVAFASSFTYSDFYNDFYDEFYRYFDMSVKAIFRR